VPTVELTSAKRRLLETLRRCGPTTARDLAELLELTPAAVRQHLAALEAAGLVAPGDRVAQEGRGRPSTEWEVTTAAREALPDRHEQLTVELLAAIRAASGARGLRRVLDERARQQVAGYRRVVPANPAPLARRLSALARQRTREGYMAEVQRERPGEFLLVEHHCPICAAAQSCVGLCRSELATFQEVLGADAAVERVEHILNGDSRCVYRVHSVHPNGTR
jgi:predicted ArsR family transcriptional regulator